MMRDRLRRLLPASRFARWLLIFCAVSIVIVAIACVGAVVLLIAEGDELIPYPDGPPPA